MLGVGKEETMNQLEHKVEIAIITGLSGAGRSQAKKVMEDFGYYCLDNLPPVLIENFIELCEFNMEEITRIALVVDIRGGIFFDALEQSLLTLRYKGYNFKLLFLEADDPVLVKRFKEVRRSHPLDPSAPLETAIRQEREKLIKLREQADVIIDTSGLNLSQFKNQMAKVFSTAAEDSKMSVSIRSFGFKKGLPIDADIVFDCRFLPNPFYIEDLRPRTGNDKDVQDYVMSFEESRKYFEHIESMVRFMLPNVEKEGRAQLVVAIGCTGGHHRSVTFANRLYEKLQDTKYPVSVTHRDIHR